MNVHKVIAELEGKYPRAKILCLPKKSPREIICEVEPTSQHPKYSKAIAIIEKSAPHLHRKSTERYKVLKGKLHLFINGKEHLLKEGEEYEIKPYTIHWGEGNEVWVETYSTPGWLPQDHRILGKEDEIHLVPYDSSWPSKFDKEKKLIEKTLGDWIVGGVHHVGSTSIPGIWAKPVIDIMVGVKDTEKARACIDLLATINYEYFPYKEEVMLWFCKPSLEHRTHHLYLMKPDTNEWRARLSFRDYLRTHEDARKAYQDLKLDLAKIYTKDRDAYTNAKEKFVKDIITKALVLPS